MWNRRKFDQTISLECAKRRRYPDQAQSCLAIIDIDHFKRINDKFGHNEGDLVLRTVAKGIQDQLRESDFIARIGGEEFAIIFPYTSIEEAEQVLNRVRLHIASLHHQQVTLSGGVTDVCTSPDQSYKRADLALYESKHRDATKYQYSPPWKCITLRDAKSMYAAKIIRRYLTACSDFHSALSSVRLSPPLTFASCTTLHRLVLLQTHLNSLVLQVGGK